MQTTAARWRRGLGAIASLLLALGSCTTRPADGPALTQPVRLALGGLNAGAQVEFKPLGAYPEELPQVARIAALQRDLVLGGAVRHYSADSSYQGSGRDYANKYDLIFLTTRDPCRIVSQLESGLGAAGYKVDTPHSRQETSAALKDFFVEGHASSAKFRVHYSVFRLKVLSPAGLEQSGLPGSTCAVFLNVIEPRRP